MEHKKRLITGIFGILLSFMMVLGFIPLPGAIKVAKAADTWTSLQAVFTSGGEISLINDVEASGSDSQLVVGENKTVTLNLNGYTIDRNLSSSTTNGRVIKVSTGGTLIINDTGGGIIKGGNNSNNTLQGDTRQGGGILVDGGILTINGGTIQGNSAMFGGGIQVYGGTVTMTGGKIINNIASYSGGGIYVDNTSTFTMSGGELSSNSISGTSSPNGGGVYIGNVGTVNSFIMNGGTIKNNESKMYGGGVYLTGSKSKATIVGGSIVNNICKNMGGGIFVSENSVIEIAENPVIINNTRQSNETSIVDNVYFYDIHNKFLVTGTLSSEAQIGVAKNMSWPISDKTFTSGYGTYNTTTSPANFFTSDNSAYTIGLSNGEAQIKVHSHSFTYSGSGTSITATCDTSGCSLTENKTTLTIVAPARTTYGGSESEQATLDNLSAFKAATGKNIAATDIKYVGRNTTTYEESSTAPTAAGDYTAKITLTDVSLTGGGTGNATASVNYTISKAEPTVTAPTATATYGQTLSNVVLTNPDGNTPGTWAFVDAGTTSVGNVGNRTFTANFTPTDTTNYNGKSNVDVTVTVGKAANPTTVINTVALVKGGNSKDLANFVTKNGATGTVTYAFSDDAKGCTLNGSMLTSGNSTGNVYVTVAVAADDNYNALEQKTITVVISDKMTQTITASDMTVTYGDTGKSISASASGGGALSYAVKDGSADYIDVDASTGALTIKKVGTATVIVTAAETNTYTQAAKEVTVTINKANAVAATVTANNRTYDGTDKPLVNVTGEATGGEMWYAFGTATEATQPYTTDIPTGTNAGTYYVWYKVVADDEHTDSEAVCVTVTITDEAVANVIDMIGKLPAPSEVTANDKEQIEAARAAYDALSDEQKGKIPEETLKKLTDAEAALAELQNDTGDTQLNPDGTKTVTEEDKKDNTIIVTTYDKKDNPVQQYIYKKAKGTSVDLKNVNSKKIKKVVVPAKVKSNGKTYKVTRIRKGFLKNCKQATKVDIGKNVNTIDKNAFNYGKKVKKVVIRGKLKKVGKGAFKNTKKNVIIKVKTGAKNFEKNKKLLEKSGLPKNATVKRVKNKK